MSEPRVPPTPQENATLPGDWELAFECMERMLMHADRQQRAGLPKEAHVFDYAGIYRKAHERVLRLRAARGGNPPIPIHGYCRLEADGTWDHHPTLCDMGRGGSPPEDLSASVDATGLGCAPVAFGGSPLHEVCAKDGCLHARLEAGIEKMKRDGELTQADLRYEVRGGSPPAPSEPSLTGVLTGLKTLADEDRYGGATYEICTWAIRAIERLRGSAPAAAALSEPEHDDILSAADHLQEYADMIQGPTDRLAVVQLSRRLRAAAQSGPASEEET